MNLKLLDILCEPVTKVPLELTEARLDKDGRVVSGTLVSASGSRWPIINGIPRFIHDSELMGSVKSFGDQWNYFNFIDFREHWLKHTVANTFGSTDVFKGKLIVDAGGGSGSQTLWMLESGAKHVIMLELSHAVDDVALRNLEPSGYRNWDIVQCSIDQPPIQDRSINGMVICHNVIQHTPSVERTAYALFEIVAPGGEFVFNCYGKNDRGFLRWIRFHFIYGTLRWIQSRCPFWLTHAYANIVGAIRLLPGLGFVLEKSGFCVQGEVLNSRGFWQSLGRRYRATVLNTFDCFGSHSFQHHKSDEELKALVRELQPDHAKVFNADRYFLRPAPIGCAIRVFR